MTLFVNAAKILSDPRLFILRTLENELSSKYKVKLETLAADLATTEGSNEIEKQTSL